LHLDTAFLDVLRFFQLTVFRHSRDTLPYLHSRCARDRKRGYPIWITPLL
jgi:hypothetical protein